MNRCQLTIKFVIISAILSVISAPAQAADTLNEALTNCAAKTNSLQRLVCYDRIAAKVNNYANTALPVASAPRPVASTQPAQSANTTATAIAPKTATASVNNPSQNVAETSFGKISETADEMTGQVAKVTKNRKNLQTIALTNGQVWQQTRSEDRLSLSANQTVIVEKGFFGAFYLTTPESNRRLSVKRIK